MRGDGVRVVEEVPGEDAAASDREDRGARHIQDTGADAWNETGREGEKREDARHAQDPHEGEPEGDRPGSVGRLEPGEEPVVARAEGGDERCEEVELVDQVGSLRAHEGRVAAMHGAARA